MLRASTNGGAGDSVASRLVLENRIFRAGELRPAGQAVQPGKETGEKRKSRNEPEMRFRSILAASKRTSDWRRNPFIKAARDTVEDGLEGGRHRAPVLS